ncbi:peptidase, M23/M37 family [Legionella lansingensis]|uniref:Peptidase, M23/M37 family n=1 Tax=Legionella lansingensis TaxID=45067 RepID=A0A0W0VVA8_9GAMM|nr:peptidoglycan DD-metalloendopeptidase family protein [Legionella lansingensis]KTD23837.1 peptidase, M23/M37 family [Legionella lansingensis]SNV46756.1 peptidase, M23/M37 family [Legionella lansingensis]
MILHAILKFFSLIALFVLLTTELRAESTAITQTKTKLRKLDVQINQLKQTLAHAHDKRSILNSELASTEKQIGEGIRQLQTIQKDMQSKQQKINILEQKLNELNKQLAAQQHLLAEHVRTRYKMGEYQPLKWLLNQDEPYAVSRLLTFYQYVIQSRQHIIDQIDATKRDITLNQNALKTELIEQKELQYKLSVHQRQLERGKRYHTAVIQSLNSEIQTKQHTLAEYEQNKANLTHLLKTLAVQSVQMQATRPFSQMRRKLPRPIQGGRNAFQRMNQGVTFFAAEGTPVTAVYPGKVVFSDWLNGYGLLLIIDHGQGFMTLYAHNQSLFKSKGSSVLQGEQVATVGHSGGLKQNGLYFEVRHRGKAISALEWLS